MNERENCRRPSCNHTLAEHTHGSSKRTWCLHCSCEEFVPPPPPPSASNRAERER